MTGDILYECKRELARLAIGPTPTKKIAPQAAQIIEGYWAKLRVSNRTELRRWLNTVRADSLQIVARALKEGKTRQAEMANGALEALDALERKDSKRG